MGSFGMLCLGVFAGGIVAYGVRQVTDWKNPGKVLASILSAVLVGGLFTAIEWIGPARLGDAIFFYPVGLVIGLLWANVPAAAGNIQLPDPGARFLGWLHIGGLVVVSLFALAILFSPRLRALLPDIQSPV